MRPVVAAAGRLRVNWSGEPSRLPSKTILLSMEGRPLFRKGIADCVGRCARARVCRCRLDRVASPVRSVARVRAPQRPVGPWCTCPPAAWWPPPLFCPGAYRPLRGSACGKQEDARRFGGLGVGWALALHALGGEIKEEVAAAGRRRGTFAGKGMGGQRPTHPQAAPETVHSALRARRTDEKKTKKTRHKGGFFPGEAQASLRIT